MTSSSFLLTALMTMLIVTDGIQLRRKKGTTTTPSLGVWSDWGSWDEHCSTTCGIGVRRRTRNCSYEGPVKSRRCKGNQGQIKNCDTEVTCPVHGGWSSWVSWTCTVTCGGGQGKQQRECTNPAPLFGGKTCEGESVDEGKCNEQPCPDQILYTLLVIAGSFHVHNVANLPVSEPALLSFSVLGLVLASLSVISSITLIIGLCTNNRLLLIPWLCCITTMTLTDFVLSLYLITYTDVDPLLICFMVVDFVICGLNVYCILCVTSQYQEYANGRGRPRQVMIDSGLPAIRFEPASCAPPGILSETSRRMGTTKSNSGDFAADLQRSPATGRSQLPYNSLSSYSNRSPIVQNRSSFSSTSEFSLYSSSDALLPGSRRGSALQPPCLSPVGETSVPILIEAEASLAELTEGSAGESSTSETVVVNPEEDSNLKNSSEDAPVLSRFRHSTLFSNIICRQFAATVAGSETSNPEIVKESKNKDETF